MLEQSNIINKNVTKVSIKPSIILTFSELTTSERRTYVIKWAEILRVKLKYIDNDVINSQWRKTLNESVNVIRKVLESNTWGPL